MSYIVVHRPVVQADIIYAVEYYKLISPKLARQFLMRLRQATTIIEKHPLAFQVKYKNVRTLLLKQFPYHIHYIVDEGKKITVILAVSHAYKNPTDYSLR